MDQSSKKKNFEMQNCQTRLSNYDTKISGFERNVHKHHHHDLGYHTHIYIYAWVFSVKCLYYPNLKNTRKYWWIIYIFFWNKEMHSNIWSMEPKIYGRQKIIGRSILCMNFAWKYFTDFGWDVYDDLKSPAGK